MNELARTLEDEIRARQMPLAQDCTWLDEVIWPAYDGLSIANAPATVARALGVDLPGAAAPLDARLLDPSARFDRVVLILLDGYGYNLLNELRAEPDFAQTVDDVVGDGAFAPLTSVFLSTTVAALTTLWTGALPATHGMLGTRQLMRDYGAVVSTLSLSPLASRGFQEMLDWGFEPDKMLGVPGIAEVLAGAGVPTHLVILSALVGSGLSCLLHRGVGHFHRMVGFTDMWAIMEELMEATRETRCFIPVYWGALDSVSHATGARSRRTLTEAREQFRRLRDFVDRWAGGDGRTLLIALADHGHVDCRQDGVINLADHLPLADALHLPTAGEARAAYLFLRAHKRDQAADYLRAHLSDQVAVIDSQAALEAGLFGGQPHHPETAARLGDMVALCREGSRFTDALDRYSFCSGHGGLAAGEMLVPVILRAL